ncbi:MAG: DUF3368 domain-containing protein [Acidobacteriota bacterium]
MIVVSDTTPLNYLIRLGLIGLLEEFYGAVYIPTAVLAELQHARTPDSVRSWAQNPPAWLVIRTVSSELPELADLDLGERKALSLAVQLQAGLLLADDLEARQAASRLGLALTGTLGVIRDATEAGRLNFDETIADLQQLGFRVSPTAIESARPQKR